MPAWYYNQTAFFGLPCKRLISCLNTINCSAVLGTCRFVEDISLPFYQQTGAAISAFNAWVMLKSLEALPSRVAAQSETAAKITEWLFYHPNIKKISYPGHASPPQHDLAKKQMLGFGSLLAFEVAGGEAAAFTVLNTLTLIDISNNFGDSKSLTCLSAR